jgi:1-acyl-sn-glycerol-3-phosphate acyltransferase
MRYLRALWRLSNVACLLAGLVIDLLLRAPKSARDRSERAHRFCSRVVRALGIEWRADGSVIASGAVVANHLSYLDILLFAAAHPFVMVAKSDVAEWPLIGWITRNLGAVFVVRGGGPATYPAVNRAMAEAFRSGYPVLFFPEGTTTDGSYLLPFRRGLLHSVLNEEVPLQAAAVQYSSPKACWWGDDTLLPHLVELACMNRLQAELRFGAVVEARRDRFELAENARRVVGEILETLASGAMVPEQQSLLVQPLEDLLDRPVEGIRAFDNNRRVLG